MKPHFGQSDAAMNKLAGCNSFPNGDVVHNQKVLDGLKTVESLEVQAKNAGYDTPYEYLAAKNGHLVGNKPKRISPISYENGFEDGYEKAKKGSQLKRSDSKELENENMTPEPLPQGYYGHHNGCDCAVCEDMHNRALQRKIVDAEWNKLLDDNKRLTVLLDAERKNVVYAQQKWAEAEERVEKWKAWYESVSGDAAKYRNSLQQIANQPLEPAHIYEIADRIKLTAKAALEI